MSSSSASLYATGSLNAGGSACFAPWPSAPNSGTTCWSSCNMQMQPWCIPAGGTAAAQPAHASVTYSDFLRYSPAQPDKPSASTVLAKRRCGRPKAPNPLEDPSIPEKKARRIMANRASADRSKQRAKLAAAEAKAKEAVLQAQLANVGQQLTDTEDSMAILQLVQAAVSRTPPSSSAVHSLGSQLQQGRLSAAQTALPAGPSSTADEQPSSSVHLPVTCLMSPPQQQQQQADPTWQALLPPASTPAYATGGVPPAAAAAAAAAAAVAAVSAVQQSQAPPLTPDMHPATAAPAHTTTIVGVEQRPIAPGLPQQQQQQQQVLEALCGLHGLLLPNQQAGLLQLKSGMQPGSHADRERQGQQQLQPSRCDKATVTAAGIVQGCLDPAGQHHQQPGAPASTTVQDLLQQLLSCLGARH